VATQDKDLDTGAYEKVQIFSKMSLPDVAKIGIIGGGELNGRLAAMGLIDEVILDIEPVVLGQGKKLFGSRDCNLRLKLLSSKRVGKGTVQNHYEVIY
jgi:dihydrofolate reductase